MSTGRLARLAAGAAAVVSLALAGAGASALPLEGSGDEGRTVLPNFAVEGTGLIRLLAGAFDPLSDPLPAQAGIPSVSVGELPAGSQQYWLVQVRAKRFADASAAITEAGASIAGTLPDDTYVVRATAAERLEIGSSDAVRWTGFYQPAWRVRPGLAAKTGLQELHVYAFRSASAAAVLDALRAIDGVRVVNAAGSAAVVIARPTAVAQIAAIPAVEWVDVAPTPEYLNANARWVNDTGVRDLYAATAPGRLTGAGQTAAVADSAINYTYDLNKRAHVAFRDCDASGVCKRAIYEQVTPGTSFLDPTGAVFTNVRNNGTGHRKVVAFFDIGASGPNPFDSSSHGSHTAGTVVGDQGGNGTWDGHDGIAPGAKLVHQNLGTPTGGLANPTPPADIYNVLRQAYRPRKPASVATTSPATGIAVNDAPGCTDPEGATTASVCYRPLEDARTHNNSWGVIVPNGEIGYGIAYDKFVWDHEDMAVIVSAGNDGPRAGTMLSPSIGKNVLSSGASANGRQPMVSIDSMASFSSHGPTLDGRYRPDLATPGQVIVSVKGGTTNGYHVAQGTSMSGPVLTGLATLVRQYFYDGYGPAGGKGFAGGAADAARKHNPSAALVKATMINGAERMRGFYTGDDGNVRALDGQWPSSGQGFGRVNLDHSLYFANDPTRNWYHDVWRADADAFAVSQTPVTRTYTLDVQAGEPLDVTLAWTDAPNLLPAGSPSLVNNLDLVVVAPDGTQYAGNNMNSRGLPSVDVAQTLPGPAPVDVRNNVERVRIAAPAAGRYTVQVTAMRIQTGRQGFALAAGGLLGADFTAGPARQHDAEGTPTIASARVDAASADTATVHFATSEPTTAQAVVSGTTFVDGYNAPLSGFPGLNEATVETSAEYGAKAVVGRNHEILLTGLAPGRTYQVTLSAKDLGGNTTQETVTYTSPASVFQPDATDIAQLTSNGAPGWRTGTQLYAGWDGGNELLGAFMFRVPSGAVEPSRITGATVELTTAHNWVVPYTQDPIFSVDLLDESVESLWGTQPYTLINGATAAARLGAETTHKRGAHQRYAFTFSCADLQALRSTLQNGNAAFRFESTQIAGTGLMSVDFGFNRRSGGPQLRPKLVLYTADVDGSPDGKPCAADTPAPTISDLGIHDGATANSVTVSWETDVDSNSVVLFREQGTTEWTQVGTPALTKIHNVQVRGLDRKKEYEFAVRSTACNGATTTDTNNGAGYDFYRPLNTGPPTETFWFSGTPADQVNKVEGFLTNNPSLYSATFSRSAPTGATPATQVGFGPAGVNPIVIDPNWVGSPYGLFWVGSYSGTIKGDIVLRWFWSSPAGVTALIGSRVVISLWADPDLSASPTSQPARRIGQLDTRLTPLTPVPREFVTRVPVDGTVGGRLLIQVAPFFTDTGLGLTTWYGATVTPSRFDIPTGPPPAPPEELPLTGPVPPPSAGATNLSPPPTRLGATAADTAAGSGLCATPDLALAPSDVTLSTQRVQGGDRVTTTATVRNIGTARATDVLVRFTVDGKPLGDRTIAAVPAGGSATVSSDVWETKGQKGDHVLAVTVDPADAIYELSEENNTASRTVTVKGNKLQNGSFESSSSGTSPDSWTGSGSTGYGNGGSDGEKSVTAGGGGTWTSAPVDVTPGAAYGVAVDASGAAGALLVEQLSSTGAVLATVTVPLAAAESLRPVTGSLTAVSDATSVRVVLVGGAGGTMFDAAQLWEK